MFDKLVPNTQRRLDNITLESNRDAAKIKASSIHGMKINKKEEDYKECGHRCTN